MYIKAYLDKVLGPSLAQYTPATKPVGVASVLGHPWGVGRIPCVHYDLVVVVLRRTSRVKLQVEVFGSRERDGLFELVVVSDGMDGFYQSARGPGGGDLDASTARVEQTTSLCMYI